MIDSCLLKLKTTTFWFCLIILGINRLLFAQDLWMTNKNIFSDSDNLKAGNIIHIVFEEPFVIAYRSRVNQLINQNKPSANISSELINFLPKFTFTKNQSENSDKSIDANLNLQGNLAAIILSIDSNKNIYTIEARRSISINYQPTTIALRGVVSSKDIVGGNINSKKIANAQISYAGAVSIKNKNFKPTDFSNLFPSQKLTDSTNTNDTNQTKPTLKEDTKRKLFIEFFNLFLNELF